MVHGAGRVGMEYHHRLWLDNHMLSNTHEYILLPGVKNIIFELRTNFIVKRNTRTSVDDTSDDEIVDSEKLRIVRLKEEEEEPYALLFYIWSRLDDYWMTKGEMDRLTGDAVAFGRRMAADVTDPQPSDVIVIPIAVELDVCTVQQEGETIEDTRARAIMAKKLEPLYLRPFLFRFTVEKNNRPHMLMNFLGRLEKVRVVNIEEGLALMKVCSICLGKPVFGAQLSSLACGHAFHNHCIIGSLERDNLCPTCRSPAYDPYYMCDDSFLLFLE